MADPSRRYFTENPSKFDPRDYLKPAREAGLLQARRFPWAETSRQTAATYQRAFYG